MVVKIVLLIVIFLLQSSSDTAQEGHTPERRGGEPCRTQVSGCSVSLPLEGPGGACVSAGLRKGHRDPQEPKDEHCPRMGCRYPRSGSAVSPRSCPPTHPQCHQCLVLGTVSTRGWRWLVPQSCNALYASTRVEALVHARLCLLLPYGLVNYKAVLPAPVPSVSDRRVREDGLSDALTCKPTGRSPHSPLRSPGKNLPSEGHCSRTNST